MREFDVSSLARVNPDAALHKATIRSQLQDFQVTESLPFEPEGEGGHVWLWIEKTAANTDWVARQLADFAGIKPVEVGYAGLKDRHAVTRQWFSVKVEGITEPDWQQLDIEGVAVLNSTRHNKKLKTGVLKGNHFQLRLRELTGDKARWQCALQAIQQAGVPNYFAEQRFGHQGSNLQRAEKWFTENFKPKKRQQRSMILSAARSWLFNQVLSRRVVDGSWNLILPDELVQLAGSHSFFAADVADTSLSQRLYEGDIHPTGPLSGKGDLLPDGEVKSLEQTVFVDWEDWRAGLIRQGLKSDRRALRLLPEGFDWHWENDDLELQFFLPAGAYATAVLRELAAITDASQRNFSNKTHFSDNRVNQSGALS